MKSLLTRPKSCITATGAFLFIDNIWALIILIVKLLKKKRSENIRLAVTETKTYFTVAPFRAYNLLVQLTA